MINTFNEHFEDTKDVTRRKTDTYNDKKKKVQRTIYNIKIEQHESHIKQHILFYLIVTS
jgi:hypothetical protein